MEFLSPRESGKYIVENSKAILIDNNGVQKVAQMVCFYILYI